MPHHSGGVGVGGQRREGPQLGLSVAAQQQNHLHQLKPTNARRRRCYRRRRLFKPPLALARGQRLLSQRRPGQRDASLEAGSGARRGGGGGGGGSAGRGERQQQLEQRVPLEHGLHLDAQGEVGRAFGAGHAAVDDAAGHVQRISPHEHHVGLAVGGRRRGGAGRAERRQPLGRRRAGEAPRLATRQLQYQHAVVVVVRLEPAPAGRRLVEVGVERRAHRALQSTHQPGGGRAPPLHAADDARVTGPRRLRCRRQVALRHPRDPLRLHCVGRAHEVDVAAQLPRPAQHRQPAAIDHALDQPSRSAAAGATEGGAAAQRCGRRGADCRAARRRDQAAPRRRSPRAEAEAEASAPSSCRSAPGRAARAAAATAPASPRPHAARGARRAARSSARAAAAYRRRPGHVTASRGRRASTAEVGGRCQPLQAARPSPPCVRRGLGGSQPPSAASLHGSSVAATCPARPPSSPPPSRSALTVP
eukprot:scaffold53235_cov68-Phaeocystis_antarctica.AAC.3